MPALAVNKNKLDVAQIYQTYLAFQGDENRTAFACNVEASAVHELALAENWPAKLEQCGTLAQGDSRSLQVTINRAINFVQATRLRSLLDKVIQHLSEGDAKDLIDRLTVEGKNGPEFKTRALADLVKAAETAQLMTQRALGDTADERPTGDDSRKGHSIALTVIDALNAANDVNLDSVEVVKRQLNPADSGNKALPTL